MNIKIFDLYNIRARLSVYIIVVSPVILTLYTVYEPVRSITFSAVLIAFIISFSNYLFVLQRYLQRRKNHKNTAAEFLYVNDSHIDYRTKQRYYRKLSRLDKSFAIFNQPSDTTEFRQVCHSAAHWLRNNTRDNKLVQEENMIYGFYKNLLSLKNIGMIFTLAAIGVLIMSLVPIMPLAIFQSQKNTILIFIDSAFLLFWIFGVNEKLYIIVCEKYAYALLGALDSFPDNITDRNI